MNERSKRHWTNCWLAGMLGFFLVSGRRNGRNRIDDDDDSGAPKTQSVPAMDASAGASRNVRDTVAAEEVPLGDPIPQLSTNTDDDVSQTATNPLGQITRGQWLIAAVVLIAVPIVAYLGTFYLYPYVQDLIEGESPTDAVLADYGVDQDAETQLLTIRRGDLVNSVSVNGTLEYANRERLSFGTSGTIDSIEVEVGDFVSEGDVMMSLDDEAIVAANESLQNASVALQDAEDKLDELTNPDDKAISDATLKVLNALKTLADAEDALADTLEPSNADLVTAELEFAEARSELETAQENLSALLEPTEIELGNAELEIAEAEKALADLIDEFADLIAQDSAAIRAAELAVTEADQSHDDAVKAFEETLSVDEVAVNQAELDLVKANLALAEAEQAIVDAQKELRDTEDNVGNDITAKKLEIAQAEAAVATAKLARSDAQEAFAATNEPFDEEEVADLREEIAKAKNDIKVAEDQLRRIEIEVGADVRKLEFDLYGARDTYQNVFFKWLGMDISGYEWIRSPDEIFADIGKTLSKIMDPGANPGGPGQRNSASENWFVDDPTTPWDEAVVSTWTVFFLTELRFDCTENGTGITSECVNVEFDDAWDDLLTKTEAYQTAKLANSQQFDNNLDALENAKSSVEDLEEQLQEALTPATENEILDSFAKQEVAYYEHVDAQNKLETLFEELEQLEPELQAHRIEASISLDVTNEAFDVALDNVMNAREHLADLQAGPDDLEISIAFSKAQKAESDLEQAIQNLEALRDLESPSIVVVNQRIQVARADLEDKIETLENLIEADDVAINVARTEYLAAQEDLADKINALDDLASPDPSDIERARQEAAVAKADLAVTETELNALINPDPATVALRRAEVATAREELATAIAATEGTHIIAPFDGVIADIPVEDGQTANPNTAAIVIADPSIVEISGTVDEVDVLFLQVGDAASIELEALGDEALIGRVSDIAAFGESNQGVVTYPVTIQTDQPENTQLPEGLSAVAEVVIREQTNKLLVPIQALFGSVNQPILLISKSDGTLEPRNVTLGISDDFWTVIEDGVSEGETILMTVVGADTSQFGGFGAVRAFAGGGGPRR